MIKTKIRKIFLFNYQNCPQIEKRVLKFKYLILFCDENRNLIDNGFKKNNIFFFKIYSFNIIKIN